MALEIRLVLGIFCLLGLTFKETLAINDRVPVLIWTNDESMVFLPVLAGHTVKKDKFKELFIDKLLEESDVKTIAVFIQDRLSLTEISTNGDVYSITDDGGAFVHAKDLMTELPSAFLSSVASPSIVLGDLETSFPGQSFMLQPPYSLGDLQLGSEEKKLVVVKLPEQHGTGAGLTDYLHHIDNILNNVTNQLKVLPGRFAAIYTGRKNQRESPFGQRSGRHLLNYQGSGNSSANGLVLSIEDQFLMHAVNISLNYRWNQNQTELSMEPESWNVSAGDDCPFERNLTNGTSGMLCTIFLNYTELIQLDDVQLKDLILTMEFVTSPKANGGYWYLQTFTMTYTNVTDTNTPDIVSVIMDDRFIDWTPFKFSYHCHNSPPIMPKKKKVPTATLR